ncbi:hypothetical protein [Pseudomonas trivialis]|uniref:Uncharacterized protein n=1 Tax=Pseudomonas trivialis TaxID=200450 RepID=A0A0H5AHF7_9PSED|nr:hypothetical protein [Pseudomonas trivialis]AKS09035.1 hypothetical protein AA957_23905 [Pseudomonas trivialis]
MIEVEIKYYIGDEPWHSFRRASVPGRGDFVRIDGVIYEVESLLWCERGDGNASVSVELIALEAK